MANGGLTVYSKNKYLDHIFGGVPKGTHSPHIGFTVSTSNEYGPGSEPTIGNYSRIALLPVHSSPVTIGRWENSVDLDTPMATDMWGYIVGAALFDSAIGGNCLVYWDLASTELVKKNGRLTLLAGALQHEFIGGLLSKYTQNLILEDLYRQTTIPVFPTLYHASYKTAATMASPGTEPSAGNYARVPLANNTSVWQTAVNGSKYNKMEHLYPQASADWGTLTHNGLHTEATGGIYIAGGVYGSATVPNPVEILSIDQLAIGAGQFKVGFI